MNIVLKYPGIILALLFMYLPKAKAQVCIQDSTIASFEAKMDSIILDAIDSMAFPGAQVLVAHHGNILLEKAYGHHTYEKKNTVQLSNLYDLASITKVSTGLPLLMKLYGEGKIDLDAPIEKYLPSLAESNKSELTLREILSHQAALKPYIVYWQDTKKKNGKYRRKTFKSKENKRFPISIHDELYLHRKYPDRMKNEIVDSDLLEEKEYRYSGLIFQMMPDLIENVTGQDFETMLIDEIYHPLGIKELCYNPTKNYSLEDIVPTESDTLFRKRLVHGTVHDEAAAMLGGISCNAGLFGNARSLYQLFQMYLNNGRWGETQIIDSLALAEFTKCQYCNTDNRRGLGFDKPLIEYDADASYIAENASASSFGHSGFTGTFVWADPDDDLIFVFLSNRVHPFRSQRKLYSMNIRPKMHQLIYDYFGKEISKGN